MRRQSFAIISLIVKLAPPNLMILVKCIDLGEDKLLKSVHINLDREVSPECPKDGVCFFCEGFPDSKCEFGTS